MKDDGLNITLNQRSAVPLYEQICQQIRSKIESRELKAGTPLPTSHEFCERLQVSYTTAHQAMATLAKEGYVSRMARRGTVVKGVPARGVVGIYSWMESLERHDGYYRVVNRSLSRLLELQERNFRMYMGSESPRTPNLACDDLIRHVGSGALCGVVLTLDFPRMEELAEAARASHTPMVSLLMEHNVGYSVVPDLEDFVCQAAGLLRERGRRRVGVIYNQFTESGMDGDRISRILREEGYGMEPHWLVGGEDTEEGGYQAAGRLPAGEMDGLIVMDDVMAMGVDRRLLEWGARVPEELTGCTFWNHGSRLRLALPFERFELDVQGQARMAMDLLQEAIGGRRISEPHRKLVTMHVLPRAVKRETLGV